MATLFHQIWIDAPLSTVYGALATAEGLGKWWAPHTSREVDGAVILAHSPGREHGDVQMKVVDLVPDARVAWEIISHHPEKSPASGWTGTRIVFALVQKPSPGPWLGMQNEGMPMTVLEFRHEGWDENSPYFGFCNYAWGITLDMLKRWCESQQSRG